MSNDTEINGLDFGPIACLIGNWKGEKGMDISPTADGGDKQSPYWETLTCTLVGDVSNAGKQHLAAIAYHQQVFLKSNDEKFHDQIGYWIWDSAASTVMHTIAIPRGVTLIAGGKVTAKQYDKNSALLEIEAKNGGDWGIAQSPFMRDNAETCAYKMTMTVSGDKLSYSQTTFLDIYGRKFDHLDSSELIKVS